jgi:hypothetical protein
VQEVQHAVVEDGGIVAGHAVACGGDALLLGLRHRCAQRAEAAVVDGWRVFSGHCGAPLRQSPRTPCKNTSAARTLALFLQRFAAGANVYSADITTQETPA